MILILTADEDEHADLVCDGLAAAGVDVARFDPVLFPAQATLSVAVGPRGTLDGRIRTGGRDIALADVHTVWLRRPGRPRAHPRLAGTAAGALVEREADAVLTDVWETLDARHVPASPDVVAHASRKVRQLRLASRLGFDLPATVVTSDPDDFLAFHARQHGDVVTKRVGPSQRLATAAGETVVRYTDPVRPRDLVHVEDLRLCPVVAQAYVPKRVELRVTVVGDAVFCAAIHSQTTHHTRHDWRRYDMAHTPMEPFPLPPEVADRCRVLVGALDLCFGTVDLVLTPDGRFVFLEVNPNGQYLWIEDATGLPITDALVALLAGPCRRAGCAPASTPLPHLRTA